MADSAVKVCGVWLTHLAPVPLTGALLAHHVGLLLGEPHLLPGLDDLARVRLAVWTVPVTSSKPNHSSPTISRGTPTTNTSTLSSLASTLHSPLVLLRHLLQRWREAPDVEGLVAVVAQDLRFRLILAPTHATGTVLALASWVVLAVPAVWLLLAGFSLVFCSGENRWMKMREYAGMTEWEYGKT